MDGLLIFRHSLSSQSNGAAADPLLQQRRPVRSGRQRLSLSGSRPLSPCLTGALLATGVARIAPSGEPGDVRLPAEGQKEGPANVQ